MMITGDKLETAENIGYLTRLIKYNFKVVRLTNEVDDLRSECRRLFNDLCKDDKPVAVIIEGKQIAKMVQ